VLFSDDFFTLGISVNREHVPFEEFPHRVKCVHPLVALHIMQQASRLPSKVAFELFTSRARAKPSEKLLGLEISVWPEHGSPSRIHAPRTNQKPKHAKIQMTPIASPEIVQPMRHERQSRFSSLPPPTPALL
jgi:hypothetical protein